MTPKMLIIIMLLMVTTLFLTDGARMLIVKRELQHSLNTAVTASITAAIDPAPMRIKEDPRIDEDIMLDNLEFILSRSMKFKGSGPITVKVFSQSSSPPAVEVSAEVPVRSMMATFLSSFSSREEWIISARAVAVYEAKSLARP